MAGAQNGQPQQPTPEAAGTEAERQAILASPHWRRVQQEWEKWLSIQNIYDPAEVAALRAELADKAAKASPAELKKLMSDLESRVAVLLSPEAEEARQWLGQLLAVARNPEAQLGGPLPDVANLSAEEIRAELDRFQLRRAAEQRSQAAFQRARAQQVQGARNMRGAGRDAPPGVRERPAPLIANRAPGTSSPYAPRLPEPVTRRPIYRVGPWGEPIYWDPLDYWRRPIDPW